MKQNALCKRFVSHGGHMHITLLKMVPIFKVHLLFKAFKS